MPEPARRDGLRVVIRTPDSVVFDEAVDSVRFPTGTGQVGIRPGAEALVTLVESGLVLLRTGERTRLAGTAGGLLDHREGTCTFLSPFAIVGGEREVLEALERLRVTPDSELAARRQLGELEQRIVSELGRRRRGEAPREVSGEPSA